MSRRRRLDAELVRRGLAPSRQAAQRLVEDSEVLVNGSVAEKSARLVLDSDGLTLRAGPPRFVSRAGLKLEAALQEFQINPAGMVCLDAGASTGGFTDCLVQNDARRVISVDVGTNQMHERVRGYDRVDVREQTDIRTVDTLLAGPDFADPQIDLVVADLSFISLRLVLPVLVLVAEPGAPILVLIKPQFEAGRVEVSKGRGVITDPAIWRRAILDVAGAAHSLGATMRGLMPSPITGASGNVEFFSHLIKDEDVDGSDPLCFVDVDAAIERGVTER